VDQVSGLFSFLLFSVSFLATLFLSGNAALVLLIPRSQPLPADLRIPLAIMMGLCLPPLCLLWTSTIGCSLSPLFAYGYVGLSVTINVVALAREHIQSPGQLSSVSEFLRTPNGKLLAGLGVVFALTWFSRFWAVHGFLVAPGADAYHHTLISTLIADQGQVPMSYEPYAPPSTYTYHFGFHAITAFMHWLTGIPLTKLTLWVGQGINALAVLSAYFLTKQLTKHDVSALIAAFLIGLVTVFPAYMVNWSRFTQLSALVILTLTAGLLIANAHTYWRVLPFLVTGIFLCHYRIFAILGILVGVLLLIKVIDMVIAGRRSRSRLHSFCVLVSALLMGLLLSSPWFIRLLVASRLFEFANDLRSSVLNAESMKSYYDLSRLEDAPGFHSTIWVALLSVIGLIRGFVQYRRHTLILVAWGGLVLLWSNPYWLALPGAGMVDINSVVMSSFVFFIVFAALGVTQIFTELEYRLFSHWRLVWGSWLVVAGIVCFSVVKMSTIAHPDNVHVRVSDLEAINWIKANVEANARFAVNPVIYGWSRTSITGSDAGYWLPLLAERPITVVPMPVINERVDPDELEIMAATSEAVINPSFQSLLKLKQAGVSYIFIGERGGPIPVSVLESTKCASKVWGCGRTRIFRINYACLEE